MRSSSARACGFCDAAGVEVCFSEQLDAWCCLECYDAQLGPPAATPKQLQLLQDLRAERGLVPIEGLSRIEASEAIEGLLEG